MSISRALRWYLTPSRQANAADSGAAAISGYDCDFVEPPPDSLLCLICTCVAREPMQMDCCGKVYCKGCLDELKKHLNQCPNCRKEGNAFTDRKSERDIKAMKVKCDNLKNGCRWVGELASLDYHHDTCDHSPLACPNECKNGEEIVQVLRKDLKTHCKNKCPNRSYQCPHCQEEGKHCDITTSHLKTCPQLEVPCPNWGCKDRLPQCEIPDHRTKCPFEKVACKYSKIGCEDKPLHKELADHENNDHLHLHIAMETILKLEDDANQIKTRLDRVDDKIEPFVFKMSKFSQLKSSKEKFYSPPFYTHQGGYKMCINVFANGWDGKGTQISVFGYFMRGENDDTLTWPFTGTLTVELLNQLKNKEHHQETTAYTEEMDSESNRRVVDRERASSGRGYHQFISHSALGYKPAINCQYLKDDCLYFRVSVITTHSPKPWLACTV